MDESHVASKEPKQADLPPQLAMWLRLVEAEFRATWERSTDAALQKIRADLTTALAATDAKLAGTVQARLAESAERLSEELAARVDASIAMALEASPGVAATHGEQPTGRSPLMAEVRALLARVAAEQAEVRSRLSQLEAGMVDVAEGLGAQLTEAIERLEFGERDGQPAFEELGTRLAAVEKAIAAVSAEKLAAAVSNGVNEAAGRLRVELAAIGREQAEIRGQLGQLEKAIAGFSDGKLTAVVNSALGDVTERLREQVTAVGREQAAIRARLTEVTEKLGAQLADFRKETGEQLATTVASSVGEST
ncbi:MAG TPA: hypothetical protein VG795_08775, partial [Acidimicrobiia bacterium]|nr:hypothetical protein [Acidimicrobiia bacterium]